MSLETCLSEKVRKCRAIEKCLLGVFRDCPEVESKKPDFWAFTTHKLDSSLELACFLSEIYLFSIQLYIK
jgi:hypothetical protein